MSYHYLLGLEVEAHEEKRLKAVGRGTIALVVSPAACCPRREWTGLNKRIREIRDEIWLLSDTRRCSLPSDAAVFRQWRAARP